jgi:mono/diheme cytochrome c family protein
MTSRSRCAAFLLGPGLLAGLLAAGAWAAEPPGDATRGAALFTVKGCGRCHVPGERGQGMGPALSAIRRPQGMLELSGRLWNHAPGMFAAFATEGLQWPDLTPEQMADLAAYLQAEPSRDPAPDLFKGRVTLVHKGCLKCHRLQGEGGPVAIELTTDHGRYESPIRWAATVWNHAPRMATLSAQLDVLYPRFSGDEMANLFEFLKSTAAAAHK